MELLVSSIENFYLYILFGKKFCKAWAPAGGGEGGKLPPPETEKIVVEKWCYFPELYKMTEVREEGIENG